MVGRLNGKTYLNWLCDLIGVGQDNRNYYNLVDALYHKDFYWSVPNDDNRAFEGKNLREKFCDETGRQYNFDEFDERCTMLELIIGLAYRCESIQVDQEGSMCMRDWFWKLIENVELNGCTDEYYYNMCVPYYVDAKLDAIINRTYLRSGRGGLFPLKRSKKDQRKVELWYQMSAYLVENYYTDDVVV